MKNWLCQAAIGGALIFGACGATATDAENGLVEVDPDGSESRSQEIETNFQADAELLVLQFASIPEGTHRNAALGTEFSFTASGELSVQPNAGALFVITDPESTGPDDREIVFIRASAFSDPTQPGAPMEEQTPWPKDDFVGWIDNLSPEIMATEPVETTLGGRDAIFTEITVGDMECGFVPGSCAGFVETYGVQLLTLTPGAQYRVWFVEQGDEDPIVVSVGINDEQDIAWFDRADEILDTLAFSDVAPNALFPTTTDPIELGTFGGIRATFPGDVIFGQAWSGRGYWVAPITPDFSGLIDFGDSPGNFEAEPFDTAEELIAYLDESLEDFSEIEPTTIGGLEARVFDYTSSDPRTVLVRNNELDVQLPDLGWIQAAAGRIWIVDHPDRGPQMLAVKSFGGPDGVPDLIEFAEALIPTIEYIEVE